MVQNKLLNPWDQHGFSQRWSGTAPTKSFGSMSVRVNWNKRVISARDSLPLSLFQIWKEMGWAEIGWENGSSKPCLTLCKGKLVVSKAAASPQEFLFRGEPVGVSEKKFVAQCTVNEWRQESHDGQQNQTSRLKEKTSFRRKRLRPGLDLYPDEAKCVWKMSQTRRSVLRYLVVARYS